MAIQVYRRTVFSALKHGPTGEAEWTTEYIQPCGDRRVWWVEVIEVEDIS